MLPSCVPLLCFYPADPIRNSLDRQRFDRHLATATRYLLGTTLFKRFCARCANARGSFTFLATGAYGNITIQKDAVHRLADGRRMLIIRRCSCENNRLARRYFHSPFL